MMMYTKKTRIIPVETVLPLEDVKRALNLLDSLDDDEVQSITEAAFELAERYCYRCFSKCSVVGEREDGCVEFFLPYGENVVISTVTVDGSVSTAYTYSDVTGKFKLIGITSYTSLIVEYECGFDTLPKSIDRGVKYLVSTIFNSGQDFVSMDVTEVPLRATAILDSEKYYVI